MTHKITDKNMVVDYLNNSVDGLYKALCLYEEKNVGVRTYIESLLFNFYNLQKAIEVDLGHNYLTVLNILEGIREEVSKEDSEHAVIRREVFKGMGIVKNMVAKLKEGE